jgi:hypothetical protein
VEGRRLEESRLKGSMVERRDGGRMTRRGPLWGSSSCWIGSLAVTVLSVILDIRWPSCAPLPWKVLSISLQPQPTHSVYKSADLKLFKERTNRVLTCKGTVA